MTDAEFLRAFEECTLPASAWTHQAHVRMAWLYLRAHPLPEGLSRARDGIQRYNAAVLKKENAYHETITCAYVRLVHDRMRMNGAVKDFASFCTHAPDLLDRTLTALLRHYRRETLFSDEARAGFVEPDLASLP